MEFSKFLFHCHELNHWIFAGFSLKLFVFNTEHFYVIFGKKFSTFNLALN